MYALLLSSCATKHTLPNAQIVPPGKPVTVEACYTVDGKPQSGQVIAFTLVDPETRAPSGATYTSTTGADCKAVAQIPASPTEDVKVVSAALLRSTKRITGFFVAQSADSITWSKDQLELTLAPNARVRVTTRVRVSATYVVDTKPKANQPITFDIKYSDGTKDTRTANTNARGVATIPLVRNVVSVAEVVASTKSSAGKTVSSVSVGAGASSNAGKSVIQWYDDGTAKPMLQLTLKPSARVPVSTTVTVTASYTEAGKPVAGRTIAFAAAFRDGTRATLSGITNAAGQATADLVKDVPIIADVTASTTSTAGQPVSGSGKSIIEWYAAPADDTDGLTMSFLIGKSIPIGVLSCTSIKRDQVDVQLAAAISADIVKQSSGLGDSSLTAKNVPVTMTSCSDQVGACLNKLILILYVTEYVCLMENCGMCRVRLRFYLPCTSNHLQLYKYVLPVLWQPLHAAAVLANPVSCRRTPCQMHTTLLTLQHTDHSCFCALFEYSNAIPAAAAVGHDLWRAVHRRLSHLPQSDKAAPGEADTGRC